MNSIYIIRPPKFHIPITKVSIFNLSTTVRNYNTQRWSSFLNSFPQTSRRSPAVQLPNMSVQTINTLLADWQTAKKAIHSWVATWHVFFFSLMHFKPCIEPYYVFLFQHCFVMGCRKKSGLNETEQSNANKGRPRQPKTCCKFTFPARHF